MLRIYVDFNIMQQYKTDDRVDISVKDHPNPIEWSVQEQVILFDSGMEVKATLQWDEQHRIWYGVPDWSTLRDVQLDDDT